MSLRGGRGWASSIRIERQTASTRGAGRCHRVLRVGLKALQGPRNLNLHRVEVDRLHLLQERFDDGASVMSFDEQGASADNGDRQSVRLQRRIQPLANCLGLLWCRQILSGVAYLHDKAFKDGVAIRPSSGLPDRGGRGRHSARRPNLHFEAAIEEELLDLAARSVNADGFDRRIRRTPRDSVHERSKDKR